MPSHAPFTCLQQFGYYRDPRSATTAVEKSLRLLKVRKRLSFHCLRPMGDLRAFSLAFLPYCFAITPRSVSPFTKNCTASATSSKTHDAHQDADAGIAHQLAMRSAPTSTP